MHTVLQENKQTKNENKLCEIKIDKIIWMIDFSNNLLPFKYEKWKKYK